MDPKIGLSLYLEYRVRWKLMLKDLRTQKYPKSCSFFCLFQPPLGTMTLYQVNVIWTFVICIQNHVNTVCQKDLYITDLFKSFPLKNLARLTISFLFCHFSSLSPSQLNSAVSSSFLISEGFQIILQNTGTTGKWHHRQWEPIPSFCCSWTMTGLRASS